MNKHPHTDDHDAVILLSPLAGDPPGPSRIDVALAIVEGRRRRRTRWWASGLAVVAVTATTAAGGTLAFSAVGRPSPAPPRPIASPLPSVTVAAPPAGPLACRVTRLPTDGVRKALVTGGDPSGRWHVGRTYPPSGGASRPLVVWKDGRLADEIRISGEDQTLKDINSLGAAVGFSFDRGARPYAYRAGKTTRLAGGTGRATAINDAGVIVGALGSDVQTRPVRWSSTAARPENLPMPAGAYSGTATDIDEVGNVLGTISMKRTDIGTGYLWLADGTTRLMPMPEVGGRRATEFWVAAMRNGWVAGRAAVETADGTSFGYFRYRIATNRYEPLPVESGMPARVAANGWVIGEALTPVITDNAGTMTVLPTYQQQKGQVDYLISSYSDDGLVVAGYAVGDDLHNLPLLWRCR